MKGNAFTKEQEIILQEIASTDKSTWSTQINDVLPQMGNRSYSNVWQKVYALSAHKPEKKGAGKKAGRLKIKGPKASKGVKKARKEKSREQLDIEAAQKRQYRKKNKPAARKGKGSVYKSGGSVTGKRRKLHKSPLRGTTMVAGPNELRFPIESLRIEGGELIVTFK